MLTEQDVIVFVEKQKTWFDLDSTDRKTLLYTTREHGNNYNERPGQEDIQEAKRLAFALRAHFGDEVAATIEIVDEWVNFNVYLNPTTPPLAPWGGWAAP